MKDLFDKGLDFVKDVTSLFEKADGERRHCPRCRGSGLLNSRRLWRWNSRSAGNQHCWFCEGVGVLPLFGLSGFMLGRATAAVNTEKLRELGGPPVQTHLVLGKYPCTRSKFGSYSPTEDLSSLLHKPSNLPVWITDAADELALQGIDDVRNKGEEVGNPSMSVRLLESKSIHRVPAQSSISTPPKSSTIHELYVQSRTSKLTSNGDNIMLLKDSATSSKLEDVAESTAGKHRGFTGGRYRIRVTRKADQALVTPVGLSFRQRIFERSRKSKPKQIDESHQKYLSMAPGSQSIPRILTNSSIRRVRCARRRRNHIREKMERETIENSWRFQRLMYFKPEPATSQDILQDPSDALQAFNGNWKDLSQKCLAELTASSRPSSKSRFPQLGPTAPYPSLVNQPFYGKLIGKLQLLPSVAKPLKL